MQHVILALGWSLCCFLHSYLADISLKHKISKTFPHSFRYYRLYYTIFSTGSFGAVVWYQAQLASPNVFTPFFVSYLAGILIASAGLVVMAICIGKYFGRLSGLKTLFIDEVHTGNELIITGIHRYVRHPLYSGTFLFIWGLFIFVPYTSLLISNFIITIYTLIGIRLEEQKLVREFGDSYRLYQKKVPKLIPGWKPSPSI